MRNSRNKNSKPFGLENVSNREMFYLGEKNKNKIKKDMNRNKISLPVCRKSYSKKGGGCDQFFSIFNKRRKRKDLLRKLKPDGSK